MPYVAPMSRPSGDRLPPSATPTSVRSWLGSMADGVLVPLVAILPFLLCVSYHTPAVLPFLPRARFGLPAASSYRCASQQLSVRAGFSRRSLVGPGDQSGPSGLSLPFLHTSSPQRQCRICLASPALILSGMRRLAKRGARRPSRNVSLHGAVPYSSPREGVQIAWIVGPKRSASFNAGEGNFCVRRPAAIGRPRTPSRRSYRAPPKVWLSPRTLAPRGRLP
jgi:hypothetical protein